MSQPLSEQSCRPCQGGIPPLTREEAAPLLTSLHPEWRIIQHYLERQFAFPDFKSALAFTNQVGNIAEEQYHHPDITVSWGKVIVKIWTHKIGGLHQNDFILANKIDQLTDT